MRSLFVGVVGVLAALLFMEGCGGAEEEGAVGTLPGDVITGTAAAVVISNDLVDNLVMCHGMQVATSPKQYPDDSPYTDLNPCDWTTYAAMYFSDESEFIWWSSKMEPMVYKTPNFEKALITIDSALGCAALCKENDECLAWNWEDPEFYTNTAADCWIDCKSQAMTCALWAAPSCEEEVKLGPIWSSQKSEILTIDGKTNVYRYAGYKPDAEWKSKLTDCPFGEKVVIEADAAVGTVVP